MKEGRTEGRNKKERRKDIMNIYGKDGRKEGM